MLCGRWRRSFSRQSNTRSSSTAGTDTPNGSWAYSSGSTWTTVDSPFTGMPAARITVAAAVPEPSTYGLLLAGGLFVAAAARRSASRNTQG